MGQRWRSWLTRISHTWCGPVAWALGWLIPNFFLSPTVFGWVSGFWLGEVEGGVDQTRPDQKHVGDYDDDGGGGGGTLGDWLGGLGEGVDVGLWSDAVSNVDMTDWMLADSSSIDGGGGQRERSMTDNGVEQGLVR